MKSILFFYLMIVVSVVFAQQKRVPEFEVISWNEQPVIKEGDKGTEGIRCGS